jgi:gas vesicle protein
MSSGKVLLGVLAGVAIGATLGILLAPDKGSVTRKKISEKSDEYMDGLEEKFATFIDGVARQFAAIKEEAAGLANDAEFKAKSADTEVNHGTG